MFKLDDPWLGVVRSGTLLSGASSGHLWHDVSAIDFVAPCRPLVMHAWCTATAIALAVSLCNLYWLYGGSLAVIIQYSLGMGILRVLERTG